jgi:hypothetical protein
VHILAAILCVLIAVVLASVVVDGWWVMPGWVIGLAVVTTVVMIASAVRIYATGVRRKQKVEGPRTKIVLADVSAPPPRSHSTGHRHASGE